MNSVVKTALVTGAVLAALAVVTSGQTAASTGAGDTQCVNLTNAEFFVLIRDIINLGVLDNLAKAYDLLPFELLAAAETRQLRYILDRLGYRLLLNFLDALPENFSHRFIEFLIKSLDAEDKATAGR
ncbi:uncharacterized protein LOC112572794 [Pomacea canaliculata]|uniref:uncharacterized protein LOC112572794 n=1 Tax=Pomacea canaliculata TaxID=400727 RepID=UPI000D73BB2C|nr:uncharacterized protein LOC112572794 [Pomacea canaliculata]XP_025108468.1 uncharacterized protein LOC112572794 [Pomacea canaliculata]